MLAGDDRAAPRRPDRARSTALTAGLTATRLRVAIREALDKAGHAYPEYLPGADHRRGGAGADRPGDRGGPLPGRRSRAATRRCAGSPSTSCSRSSSGWSRGGAQRVRDAAPQVAIDAGLGRDRSGRRSSTRSAARVEREVELTGDQAAAMTAIRDDLARPTPMLRLLQGDVGSGKTAVAAYALAADGPGRAARARSSPRPTCSPASTSRRWARCSRASGSA